MKARSTRLNVESLDGRIVPSTVALRRFQPRWPHRHGGDHEPQHHHRQSGQFEWRLHGVRDPHDAAEPADGNIYVYDANGDGKRRYRGLGCREQQFVTSTLGWASATALSVTGIPSGGIRTAGGYPVANNDSSSPASNESLHRPGDASAPGLRRRQPFVSQTDWAINAQGDLS